MTDELQLALLGPPEIRRAGTPVTGFTSTKVQALLCFLAVTGQAHLRPSLAGLLWGEMPEASAQNALRKALSNLRALVGPHLTITRQAVTFNGDSAYWLDVKAFESLAGGAAPPEGPTQPAMERLARAVALYRGDFLAGFYVRDAPAFEEWVLSQRARLRELALQALHSLAVHHTRRGEAGWAAAIDYTTQLLALEPWREEAHRQLMLLLALSGQRGAALCQYETCRAMLAQELGVEPGAATIQLYEKIRDDQVELAAQLPPFLQQDAPEEPCPLFVARENELARLDAYLERALAGQGQAVFVTGGPGRGKTSLLGEFARRAMAAHPDLLVAGGRCSALAGPGDPYLPFREILAMLTGDVAPRWAAGSISRDHAWCLWDAVPLAARALLDCGPHVTSTLLDGPAFLSRATAAAASPGAPWLQQLRERVERQHARPEGLEADFLLAQVTNVLLRLAEDHPLLLIVDDLQWADASSTGLLFHLGRRLAGHRLLVACACRPEEVPFARDGTGPAPEQDLPLAKVLAELKQQFGDVWIDLSRLEDREARVFVNALLDAEPNRLGRGFREALFRRTVGHPLFTVELLRTMQERQDLLLDEEDRWMEGPALRWETLPARVEGAIEQRIGRLAPELRALLTVACVEGEVFTAQVMADVQGSGVGRVLRVLTTDLQRQHRLVQAQDELQVGPQHLSRYRFGHVLFRDYLYHNLSPGERRLLHRQVGTALKELYGNQVGEIAGRLAHHFAGDPEKERHYARLAGERAAAQYANEEALLHLGRALELTPESDLAARCALLLAREQVYDRQSNREAQRRDLAALEEVATALADPQKQAEVALRQAWHAWQRSDFPQAIRFASGASHLGHAVGDLEIEAQAHRLWSIALQAHGDNAAAESHFEQGLALARAAGARWLEAEIRRQASWVHMDQGEYQAAEACLDRSLRIFQEIGDRHDEMRIHLALAGLCQQQFNYGRSLEHSEHTLRLSRELGTPLMGISALDYEARVLRGCGDYKRAHTCFEQILARSREIGIRSWEGRALLDLAHVAHALGDSEQALPSVEQALELARETGDRGLTADAMSYRGHYLEAFGQCEEAGTAYEQSVALRREMGLVNAAVEPQAGLARVHLAGGDLVQALELVEGILSHLACGTLEGTEQPLLVYLTCYRALQAVEDPRAETVLEEGYELLWEIAARITDEELRHSFLENVAAHRELLAEYTRLGSSVTGLAEAVPPTPADLVGRPGSW